MVQILNRRCEEVQPVPGQHNGHDRAREGRIFGTDPRVNIWPFGLSTATFTAYELLQTGPLYHMDTALCSWADPTGSGRRLGHTYRPRSLRGLHGDGASSWSPQRPFIGVFGERAAWLMMTEHGPTLEGTTYRQ